MALSRSDTSDKKPHKALFSYQFCTRIHDIDAAGVMFFARHFYYAHDAYEEFLIKHNLAINSILKSDYMLPVSHTEADFKAAIFLNEIIIIEVVCSAVKDSEFSLEYLFFDQEKILRTVALTRHVCIDSKTRKRRNLPDKIRAVLT